MRVMILAAGLGTRLRPLTDYCPKPLLPLMLQPLLEHWLHALQRQGVEEVIVNTHHHAAQLQHWLGDGRRWGLAVTLSYEAHILGTAGAMKRVAQRLHGEPFLVLNADVLADLDLRALWRWHLARPDAMVTMVLRPDPAARSYGAVVVDAAGRVVHINGRPACNAQQTGVERMFTGIQVVSPQVLDTIPGEREIGTTTEVYPALLAQGQAVYGYDYTGYWMDVGVPERYLQAHRDVFDGSLGDTWRLHLPAASQVIGQSEASPRHVSGAWVIPPVVLGPDVRLEPGAQVGPYAVLDRGCTVAMGARVQESVVGSQVFIGAHASVQRCVLGTGVHIPAKSSLCDVVRAAMPTA